MKSLETYERVMLRDLFFENDFLDIYFFHKKYLLSHQQIYEVLDRYARYFDIQKIETGINQLTIRIKLNDYGRLQVWQQRYNFFKTNDDFLGKSKQHISTEHSIFKLSDKSLKFIKRKIDNNILSPYFCEDTNN